jgi:hypothetical protein
LPANVTGFKKNEGRKEKEEKENGEKSHCIASINLRYSRRLHFMRASNKEKRKRERERERERVREKNDDVE